MQPTALFVFVALALLQAAFVRGKLLNFNNQKDLEGRDNVESDTAERVG
jgi:hypothetical protein